MYNDIPIILALNSECSFPISMTYIDYCDDFESIKLLFPEAYKMFNIFFKKSSYTKENLKILKELNSVNIENYLHTSVIQNKNYIPEDFKKYCLKIDAHYNINSGTSILYISYCGLLLNHYKSEIKYFEDVLNEFPENIQNYFSRISKYFVTIFPNDFL